MTESPSVDHVVERVCCLARDFHERGDVSVARLIEESGYSQRRHEITLSIIKSYLSAHRDLIGDWLVYSDNKRVSSGWYFGADSVEGPYRVGFFPADSRRKEQCFLDGAEACATFVKAEFGDPE